MVPILRVSLRWHGTGTIFVIYLEIYYFSLKTENILEVQRCF
jgi:hypothetical protein